MVRLPGVLLGTYHLEFIKQTDYLPSRGPSSSYNKAIEARPLV